MSAFSESRSLYRNQFSGRIKTIPYAKFTPRPENCFIWSQRRSLPNCENLIESRYFRKCSHARLLENTKTLTSNQVLFSFLSVYYSPMATAKCDKKDSQATDLRYETPLLKLGLSASASESTCHQAPGYQPEQALFSFRSVKHLSDAKIRADRRLAACTLWNNLGNRGSVFFRKSAQAKTIELIFELYIFL